LIIVSSLFHRPLCAQWLQALEIYVSTPNHNALHRHPGHSLKIVLAQDGCGRSSFRGDQAWDAVLFASPGKMSTILIDSPFKKMFDKLEMKSIAMQEKNQTLGSIQSEFKLRKNRMPRKQKVSKYRTWKTRLKDVPM
jgi:hypothetical protein